MEARCREMPAQKRMSYKTVQLTEENIPVRCDDNKRIRLCAIMLPNIRIKQVFTAVYHKCIPLLYTTY